MTFRPANAIAAIADFLADMLLSMLCP